MDNVSVSNTVSPASSTTCLTAKKIIEAVPETKFAGGTPVLIVSELADTVHDPYNYTMQDYE